MSILLAYANDYLAIRSVDSNGHFHTKLHHVGQLRAVKVTNKVLGQSILPDQGYTIQQYAAIGSEHSNQLNHMVLDKGQWSKSAGDAEDILKPELRDYLHKLFGLIEAGNPLQRDPSGSRFFFLGISLLRLLFVSR